MKPGWKIPLLIIAAVLLPLAVAGDDEYEFIVITKAPRRVRVAAPDVKFISQPAAGDESDRVLTRILRDTIELAGLFELVAPDAYPYPVVATGRGEDFAAWQLIGTDLLIRTDLAAIDQDRYQAEFRCYDIRQKKVVLGKRYTGAGDMINRMALRYMDELIGWLTTRKSSLDARIAFVTDLNLIRRTEIHVMDTDGSHDQPVTRNRTLNLSPSWSPDGRYLVYTGYRGRNPDLYIADLVDNKEWRFFSKQGLNSSPEFSPDGRLIAFTREGTDGNIDICVIGVNGQDLKRITFAASNEVSPSWSPDSMMLAFASDRTGNPQIYLLDLTRGPESQRNPAVRLTNEGSYNTFPAWSPDGRWIAYSGRVGGQFELFLIDMTGQGRTVRRLTATSSNEETPSWSPDSRFLVYASNKYGNYDIYVMSIYGGSPRRITQGTAQERMPAWSPRAEL